MSYFGGTSVHGMTKELQRSAKNRLGGLAHKFFTRKGAEPILQATVVTVQ